MNIIYNNPFRVLGLPITASEREITKQINVIATYAEMGKLKSFDTDFPFLVSVERTSNLVDEVKKQIEQNESKFLYSVFWFWQNNTVDELALEILKDGDIDKAIAIWEKPIFINKETVYKSQVFIENLIESSKWSEENDEDHHLQKDENVYIIERKKDTNSSIPSIFADLEYGGNWTIEVDTEWLDGVDNIGYGIIFGREKGSYYMFDIAANGYYCLSKNVDWSFTKLIPWKKTDVVDKRSKNHLLIKKTNELLSLYINGTYVDSFQSEPFFGKNFGFKVTNNQKILFKNFKFCKLVEDDSYGSGIRVTSKNFSNIKNLSTLYLGLIQLDSKFQINYFDKAISLAKHFFISKQIEDLAKLIAGERYNYNAEKTLQFYIDEVINLIKGYLDEPGGITIAYLINSFSTFPIEAARYLHKRFIAKPIQKINDEIEIANASRKSSPATAIDAGKQLVSQTKEDVDFLKTILSKDDFQYPIIADKLALEIVQCGIDSFNFYNNTDYPKAVKNEEFYLTEYQYAFDLAVTDRAKQEAKKNLDSCQTIIGEYKKWSELEKERHAAIEARGKPIKSAPTLYTINGIGTTIYDSTLYFVFFGIPIIPLSRYNCSRISGGYTFYGKLKLHLWQRIWKFGLIAAFLYFIISSIYQDNQNNTSAIPYTASNTSTSSNYSSSDTSTTSQANNTSQNKYNQDSSGNSSSIQPIYRSVILDNGNIPGLKPKYDRNAHIKLIISAQSTDATVQLCDFKDNDCIRYVYIHDGTSYTVRNIPEGKFYLTIAYGKNWVVKDGDSLDNGHFTPYPQFKYDTVVFERNYTYTEKLYTTSNILNDSTRN